jgi:myosin heavy subunit
MYIACVIVPRDLGLTTTKQEIALEKELEGVKKIRASSLEEKEAHIAQLEELVNVLQGRIKSFEEELERHRQAGDEMRLMEDELSTAKRDLDEAKSVNAALLDEVKKVPDARARVETLEGELEHYKQAQEKVSAMEGELANLKNALDEARSENATLNKRTDEALEGQAEAREELLKASSELQCALEAREDDRRRMEDDAATIDMLRRDLALAAKDAQSDAAGRQLSIKSVEDERDQAHKEVAEAFARLRLVEEQTRALEAERDLQMKDCEEARRRAVEAEHNARVAATESGRLKDEMEQQAARIRELEAQVSLSVRRPTATPAKFEGPDINSLREKINAAARRSNPNNNSLRNSTSSRFGGEAFDSSSQAEVQELRNRLAELEARLDEAERERSSWRHTIGTAVLSSPARPAPSHSRSLSTGDTLQPAVNADDHRHPRKSEWSERRRGSRLELELVVEGQNAIIADLRGQIAEWHKVRFCALAPPCVVCLSDLCAQPPQRGESGQRVLDELHKSGDHAVRAARESTPSSSPIATSSRNTAPHLRDLPPNMELTSSTPLTRTRGSMPPLSPSKNGHGYAGIGYSPEPLPTPPHMQQARKHRRITIERDIEKLESQHAVEKNKCAFTPPSF